MNLLRVAIAIVSIHMVGMAQEPSDVELAYLLADESTRQMAVAGVVTSGDSRLSLLLSWAQKPPPEVDQHGLYIGLAEVFGKMRTEGAIPFLIENIGLRRGMTVTNWLKTAEVIQRKLPAVGALVQIGSPASMAIIRAFPEMTADDRLAAIFALSEIADPAARSFLSSVRGRTKVERLFLKERGTPKPEPGSR